MESDLLAAPRRLSPACRLSTAKMAGDVDDQITVTALLKKQQDCQSNAVGSQRLPGFRGKCGARQDQRIDAIELSSGFEAATEPKMPPWALIIAKPAA